MALGVQVYWHVMMRGQRIHAHTHTDCVCSHLIRMLRALLLKGRSAPVFSVFFQYSFNHFSGVLWALLIRNFYFLADLKEAGTTPFPSPSPSPRSSSWLHLPHLNCRNEQALFGSRKYRPQIEYHTKAIGPAGCPYLFALLSPHYLPLLPPPSLCLSLYTCIVSCQLESCDFPWSRLACLRFRACKVFKTIAEATRQHMSGGGAGETKLSMTFAENRRPNSIIHTHTHICIRSVASDCNKS